MTVLNPSLGENTVSSMPATVALLGDSITQANAGGPGLEENPSNPTTSGQFQANGYWTWACNYLGGRALLAYNAGLTGATTDTVLSTHLPIVLALNPKPTYCVVLIGINDIQNLGRTGAQIVANIQTICQALINAGITPVLCTLTPAGPTVLSSAARYQAYYDTQRGIIKLGHTMPVILCNWTAAAGQSDSSWKANYGDAGQLHPQTPGAQALGQVLANVLAPYVAANNDAGEAPFANNDYHELTTNPLMTGSNAINTSGITGNIATGWGANWSSGAGTAALSKVARTDLWAAVAEWQQLQVSAQATGRLQLFWTGGITAGFTPGEEISAGVDFQADADWANCQEFTMQVIAWTASFGSKLWTADACGQASSTAPMLAKSQSGRLRIPPFVVPANTAILYPQIRFQGTGTVRVSRFTIRQTD